MKKNVKKTEQAKKPEKVEEKKKPKKPKIYKVQYTGDITVSVPGVGQFKPKGVYDVNEKKYSHLKTNSKFKLLKSSFVVWPTRKPTPKPKK